MNFLIGNDKNHFVVVDLNEDGRLDIVGSRTTSNAIFTLLNTCGSLQVADLATTISAAATVNAGDQITYTVHVANNGPNEATGVVATTVLPTGMQLREQRVHDVVIDRAMRGGVDPEWWFGRFPDCWSGSRCRQPHGPGDGDGSAESDPDTTNNASTFTTVVNAAPLTFTVTNTNDSGAGSLRQAITDSNLNTGSTNQIHFNIGAGGAQSIALPTALPAIPTPVVIDGWTQPGFTGAPLIELNGAATTSGNGLIIFAGPSTVRGLVINRFKASGIALSGGSGHTVQGNYIGTNAAGTTGLGQHHLRHFRRGRQQHHRRSWRE